TGVPIATETLIQLAQHPRIVAVKDAKGDLGASSQVMLATDLVYYSGEDMLNLPMLAIGATGFVSVVGHVVGDRLHEMIDAYLAGRVGEALEIHREILPDFSYLDGRLNQIEAVVLTHAHEDHIGAVPYLLRERPDLTLVGSKLTLGLVKSKLAEHRQAPATVEAAAGTRQSFGPFGLE